MADAFKCVRSLLPDAMAATICALVAATRLCSAARRDPATADIGSRRLA
jgi:hypothetical protein